MSSLRPCCRSTAGRRRAGASSTTAPAAGLSAARGRTVPASRPGGRSRPRRVRRLRSGRDAAGAVTRQTCAPFLQQPIDGEGRLRAAVVERKPLAGAGHRSRPPSAPPMSVVSATPHQAASSRDVTSAPISMPERPRGDVVRRFGRRRGRTPHLGIRLPLEQVLGVPGEHLVHRHDERAGGVVAAIGLERAPSARNTRTPPICSRSTRRAAACGS